MPLELQNTTLKNTPFFDDFSTAETNNYHRILFRPAVSVQTRELTQLQTILQNQIERFGENIYKSGTIIKGVTQYFDSNYQYIKINDSQLDGQAVDVASYSNTLIVNESTGLQAVVVNYSTGLQSQDPDLATLYLKYLNTGSSQEKVFGNTNILTIYNRNRTVESVTVVSGGTLYSNSDSIVFTSSVGGTGAVGQIITYANGTIKEVLVTQGGSGYTSAPTVSITTSTGSGASLTASHFIARVQVANSSFTNPVGTGYAMSVSDGIIFQKGHFVRVNPQTTLVSKYSSTPNNAVVGFYTQEAIVNSSSDSSLLDNAAGSENESAPGAFRLQLIPTLVTKTKEDAQSNTSFFGVVEFQNGKKVRQTEETEFNSIGRELAKRTYDESGNYVVTPFPVYTESISGNTTHLNVAVGAGAGYIEGYRIKNSDNILTPIRKGTDTAIDNSQTISTNFGSYVEVNELFGVFDHTSTPSISLRTDVATGITSNIGGTPTLAGSQIGTARLRSVMYDSGIPGSAEAVYRLYLFDIKMSPGTTFSDVRSVGITGTASADVILDAAGNASLKEIDYDGLVFKSGTYAVKELTNEQLIYRAYQTTPQFFSLNGEGSISLSGAEEFPYTPSSTLNDTQERDFIIIPTTAAYAVTPKSGKIQTFGNTTVQANTGQATQFFSDYNVGEYIVINTTYYRITRIINNTILEVDGNPSAATSQDHYLGFPAYVPISTLRRPGAGISIDSTGKTATIDLGSTVGTLSAQMDASVFFNVKVDGATQKTKSIVKDRYVKISNTSIATSPNGPWCLGVSDVHKITGVYRGSGSSFSEAVDITSYFDLNNGQRDNYYGLAYIKRNPAKFIDLSGDTNLLVKLDYYTHSAGYYCSTESFPIDDTTVPVPGNKIRTEEVEVYKSPSTGKVYDLRDSIDFRPKADNTVTPNTSISSAPVVTSIVEVFTGTQYYPTPNEALVADVESYLSRIDRVTIDSLGNVRVVEGKPKNNPSAPSEPAGCMTLGLVNVPPYPTLSPADAATALRPDLATKVINVQQRRYTMKDLSDLDKRVSRLEYYSLLNSLEQDTKNLLIPSEANSAVDRFKNGFFVDPFNNYDVASVNDPEYSMFIDVNNSVARPKVQQHVIDLTYNEAQSSNTTLTGDQVTLEYDSTLLIEQPFATKYRNCVENQYHYKGTLFLFPEYDNYYDTTVSPAQVTLDIAGAIDPLVQAINASFERIGGRVDITNSVSSEQLIDTIRTRTNGGTNVENVFQETTVNTGTETRYFVTPGSAKDSIQTIGDFVTSMTMQPYIRPQVIKFVATGLRPNAQYFVFFDKKNVSAYIQPANIRTETTISDSEIFSVGGEGENLYADDRGILAGLFYVPAGVFFCGERELVVMDVDSFDSETASTSKSVGVFNAYNFSVEKRELSFNTKAYTDINLTQSSTPYTSTTRTNFSRTTFVSDPPADPIAQSFKVEAPDPALDGVVVTKVDLYFKRKDPVLGLNVEIREVNLGTPASTRIPFAYARVASNDVVVSEDASEATTVTFPTPVYLKSNQEYALVVYPDAASPEYLIFTGEAGGVDLTNPSNVKKNDWGLGALFLSTNGTTWQGFQYEDMKFRLYRADFTKQLGTVATIPDGYEFLTINPLEGTFKLGEPVAQKADSYLIGRPTCNLSSRSVGGINTTFTADLDIGDHILVIYGTSPTTARAGSVESTDTTVTGTSTAFQTQYAVGDYIKIDNQIREVVNIASDTELTVDAAFNENVDSGNNHYGVTPVYDILQVLSVSNETSMVVDKYPRVSTTASVVASYQKVVKGIADFYRATANTIYLKQSTAANSNFKVVTGRQVVGGLSDATANVISINDITSSFVECHINTFIPPATTSALRSTSTRTDGAGSYTIDNFYGVTNKLPYESVIKSRSNEISGTTIVPSFSFIQSIASVSSALSPLVDVNPASVVVLGNDIDSYADRQSARGNTAASSTQLAVSNNGVAIGMGVWGLGITGGTVVTGFNGSNVVISTEAASSLTNTEIVFVDNETNGFGINKNRYISKKLTLEDGMDAEDIKVFLTAFKPVGSEIDVYARILNGTDGETFNDKDWTKLIQVTPSGIYSDSLNDSNYIEYEYTFPTAPPSIAITGSGSFSSSSNVVTGFSSLFESELEVGDIVKVVQDTSGASYDIRVIGSISSNTSLTLTEATSFASSGALIEKVVQPKAAFKYVRNDGVVRYYSGDGGAFDTYKVAAIKIVIKSENAALVPILRDIRALAVSV